MNERKRLCGMQDCPREAVPFISYIALCVPHLTLADDAVDDFLAQPGREAKRQERQERLGCVYIIRVDTRIKVGFSIDPHRRLQQYPPGSELLALVGRVPISFEQDLHGRLAQHRVAGREWYRDCDEIRQLVADLNAEHGAPTWQPTWGDGQPRRPRRTVTAPRRAMVVDHRR